MTDDRLRRFLGARSRINEKLSGLTFKISGLSSFLEKNRALDCIFILYFDKGKWKQVNEFLYNIDLPPIKDGAFRARMSEMEELGLVRRERIDPLKVEYKITEQGKVIADFLLKLSEKL